MERPVIRTAAGMRESATPIPIATMEARMAELSDDPDIRINQERLDGQANEIGRR